MSNKESFNLERMELEYMLRFRMVDSWIQFDICVVNPLHVTETNKETEWK